MWAISSRLSSLSSTIRTRGRPSARPRGRGSLPPAPAASTRAGTACSTPGSPPPHGALDRPRALVVPPSWRQTRSARPRSSARGSSTRFVSAAASRVSARAARAASSSVRSFRREPPSARTTCRAAPSRATTFAVHRPGLPSTEKERDVLSTAGNGVPDVSPSEASFFTRLPEALRSTSCARRRPLRGRRSAVPPSP